MASITSAGLGSGLDISGIVTKLVAAERAPTEARLNQQQAKIQAKLSAYGAFKSALATFNSAVSGLKDFSTFQKFSTTSSDDKIVSASGGSSASKGSYSIEVTDLAASHKLASGVFASDTDAVGTGKLTFSFGTYDAGANTFATNGAKASATVTIASGDNSLRGIRDAVNKANIGVTASIVKDTSGYRLVFKSNDTGAANSLKVTVGDDSDGNNLNAAGLSALAYDPTAAAGSGKNLTQSEAAADAVYSVDGLSLRSASNRVTDAISGVTLELKGETTGTPITVKVGEDRSAVSKAVENLVSGFNSLNSTITSLAGYDKEAKRGGVLLGDSAVREASNAIRQALTSAVEGAGGFKSLADVGVKFQADGTLKLDKSKLESAMDSSLEDVARLFAATGKPSDPLVRYDSASSKTRVGTYGIDISQLATQATYSGSAVAAPFTVDSGNDAFGIKVNGIQSGTISLTQRTYASGEDLATELQSRINGDSALKNAGVSVTVQYSAGRLEISSATYGSSSKVKITSVDTNTTASLGLAVSSEMQGQDVAGTIGGAEATGSGRYLTGTGSAADLKLEVLGGLTGDRGTVEFGRGLGDRLSSILDRFLGSNNALDARTKGLNGRLDDIGDQRERLDKRIEQVEKRYRAQFNALDGLLAQLQATGSQLSQQLASLPGLV